MTVPSTWGKVAMFEAFIDAPIRHEKLTVFPVIAPHGPVLPYLLSTEIRDSDVLNVREKDDSHPPFLLARNNSRHPLLVLAGEPLPGGDLTYHGQLVHLSVKSASVPLAFGVSEEGEVQCS